MPDSRYNITVIPVPDLNPDLISDLVPDLVPDVAPATETTASDSLPFMACLPAYQRYDGRFFAHVGQNAFEQASLEDCHVLIVSGLYGLLLPEEPIQAYNCHLDDEIIGPIVSDDTASDTHTEADTNADVEADAGARIADIWRRNGFSNRLLKAFIHWHDHHHDHRIQQVVDILSETSYQRLFNWDGLYSWFKRRRITWFHRLVQAVREPAFLADLGRWFRHEVVEKDFVPPPPPGKLVRPYLHNINKGVLNWNREEGDFREGILIFTSNLLQNAMTGLKADFQVRGHTADSTPFRMAIKDLLIQSGLAPELCGRINRFLVYNPLSLTATVEIVFQEVLKLGRRHGCTVHWVAPHLLAQVTRLTAGSSSGVREVRDQLEMLLGRPLLQIKRQFVRPPGLMIDLNRNRNLIREMNQDCTDADILIQPVVKGAGVFDVNEMLVGRWR